MNPRVSSTLSPLNVVGCQSPGSQKLSVPNPALTMAAKNNQRPSAICNKTSITIDSDDLDLKLENDRRLQEMREQGKQCLLDRDEHSSREQGAANLLARFHSMHWMRQPQTEVPAGTSQAVRSVEPSLVNLVPMKHGDEEYFPGTRQSKKPRRSKNTRPKYEVLRLEEAAPAPNDKIMPAGYHINAWAGRKGSDLFESRKLNLTLYGPDDSDEVFQRAVQESLITLSQEQDRIVNMFSSVQISSEEGKTSKNLANGRRDSWSRDRENLADDGGGGDDGRLIQSNCTRSVRNIETNVKEKVCESSKCFDEDLLKMGSSHHQGKPKHRLDAGDCQKIQLTQRDYSENRSYQNRTKDKWKEGEKRTYVNKCKIETFKEQGSKKEREDNQEMEHERLGFSKKRNEQYAQRDISRRRPDNQSRDHSDLQEKPYKDLLAARAGDPKGRNNPNSRDRHISFSDPLVQPSKNDRCNSSAVLESDNDPWLEPEEKLNVLPHNLNNQLVQLQPVTAKKPHQQLSLRKESNVTFQGDKSAFVNSNSMQQTMQINSAEMSDVRDTTEKISKEKNPDWEKISPSKRDTATSPEPSEVLQLSEDSQYEEEKMKKMREEIEFLDSRLRLLTTALEQSHTNGIQEGNLESKDNSSDPEQQQPTEEIRKGASDQEETENASTTNNLWFHTFPHGPPTMPLLRPPMIPLVHPVIAQAAPHSLPHPPGHSVPVAVAHAMAQPAHPLTQSAHSLTQPAHPLAQPTQPLAQPAHPLVQPGHPLTQPSHSLGQSAQLLAQPAHLMVNLPTPHPAIVSHLNNPLNPHPQMQQNDAQIQQHQTQMLGTPNFQTEAQPRAAFLPEILPAQLQGQNSVNFGMTPEIQMQLAQRVSQQQLAMQHAAASAAAAAMSATAPSMYRNVCLPNPMALNWAGLNPQACSTGAGSLFSQVTVPSQSTTSQGIPITTGLESNNTVNIVCTSFEDSSAAGMITESSTAEKTFPALITAKSAPETELPVGSNLESENPSLTANEVETNGTSSSAQAIWFAQMKAIQQHQQQQMMQLMNMVPGMRGPMAVPNLHTLPFEHPLMKTPLPNWQIASETGTLPSQYEGDWIISPADQARLGQGLPLVPSENQDSAYSSSERHVSNGTNDFPDIALNPTGSVRALGLPVPASLKPARLPAHLAGLKQQQHADSAQVDMKSAVAENTFQNLSQPPLQISRPTGVRSSSAVRPEEPRGRGRLR